MIIPSIAARKEIEEFLILFLFLSQEEHQ